MENILMYITNHYLYFVIAAIILIIATVGFVVEEKKQSLDNSKDVPMTEEEIKAMKEKEEAKNNKEKK